MKLYEAVSQCKTYGYVSRTSVPEMKYYKNHHKTIIELVIVEQGGYGVFAHDWEYFNSKSVITKETKKRIKEIKNEETEKNN